MRNATDVNFILSEVEVKELAKKFFPDIRLYIDTHQKEFIEFKNSYEANAF